MSTLDNNDCTRKEFMNSSNKLIEFYQSTIEIADKSKGQIKLLKAYIDSRKSGYGAFYQYNDDPAGFEGNNNGRVRIFKGQYIYSPNNRAVINISDYSDTTGNEYNIGSSCISTKPSEADKEIYEYNLYDANGKLVTLKNPSLGFVVADSTGLPFSFANNPNPGDNFIYARIIASANPNNQYWINNGDITKITDQLKLGKKLYARSWYNGNQNLYPLEITSDGNSFIIIDPRSINRTAYKVDESIKFSLDTSVNSQANKLFGYTPIPNTSIVNFEYMGEGYIWSDSPSFNFIDGAQITSSGQDFYVRAANYKLTPKIFADGSCNSISMTAANSFKTDLDGIAATYTDFGNKSSLWKDPRNIIGTKPVVTKYKYIDGRPSH